MITRKQLAPPYRPQDLLSVSNFINFCEQNGVKVDREDLEFYDKQNVIVPALRVRYGCVAYRKILASFGEGKAPEWGFVYEGDENKFDYLEIDKKTYYNYGGIFRQGADWLKYYEENELTEIPAEKEFRSWDKYKLEERFSPNKKGFIDAAQSYYSPYQMLDSTYLRQQVLPMLSQAGLIAEEASPHDRRTKLIYPQKLI